MPYYQLFNHFPTRPLAGADSISIAENGVRLLDENSFLPAYPELRTLISSESLSHILVLCRHQARSAAFLQERLQAARHLTPESSLYHLLWGLKQGLLRVSTKE